MSTPQKESKQAAPPRYDDTLYQLGTKRAPLYAVRLRRDSAALLFAIMALNDASAQEVTHQALVAVWSVYNKYPPRKDRPKIAGQRKKPIAAAGPIANQIANAATPTT